MKTAVGPELSISSSEQTVTFIDLAGYSSITDVYGDEAAISILGLFERLVRDNVGKSGRLIKWIGDEAMLMFPDPDCALAALGRLLPACRHERDFPLTRSGLHHGRVVHRDGDVFGSSVNIAARITALAQPGQMLATRKIADAAKKQGILVESRGLVGLRSIAGKVELFSIPLAENICPAWIDPVCKTPAPYTGFCKEHPRGPWFCSKRCEDAYLKSPDTYSIRERTS